MQITVNQIATLLNGTVEGDGARVITHPGKIEEAGEGALSFLANLKYLDYAYTTGASAILAGKDIVFTKTVPATIIRVDDAYSAMARLLDIYQQGLLDAKKGVENPSYIDKSVNVPADVYVGAFAYIGRNVILGAGVKIFPQTYIGDNVVIGDGSILYAGAKVYDGCIVGRHCIIHSGAIIGSDGFGFAPQPDGSYKKIPQTGNVVLEDYVEVGSNTTIDRATMGSTIIKKGAKLDNLIQIAHNVEVGESTVIAAQTGVSGSTKLGKHCRIGGQVGFAGHLHIADGTQVNAQSGIAQSIDKAGTAVSGSPAIDYRQWQRASIAFKQLPQLLKDVNQLKNNE